MQLTDHDLKQINQEYLASLSRGGLLHLSGKMLDDLRDARDRLNQTPQNSSRPSGSYAPWEQAANADKERQLDDSSDDSSDDSAEKPAETEEEVRTAAHQLQAATANQLGENKRKPGKQPGSQGVGREVKLAVTGEIIHQATSCAGCGGNFGAAVSFQATTARYMLDIERTEHGLQVSHVKHIYGEERCGCGHVTQTLPGRCADEQEWAVALTEWHLVGPRLSSLMICLSLRMRLSRPRIQEFLSEWLGITLSLGCINQCIHEGGRAVAPLEDALVAEIQQSDLLHADETGWQENGQLKWLWVLRTATVTLYLIGRRNWDVIAASLNGFQGWLMSDGYGQYRYYAKRVRCLAHILRKARGLAESCHPQAAEFGQQVLKTVDRLIHGVPQARGDPTRNLLDEYQGDLAQLRTLCEQHRDHAHEKTRQLARELRNDWQAIWRVLEYPTLPITNNPAEQSLRHWVIARKISHGTRTPEGSRAYALLASVIDTCRQRGLSPWPYLAEVIAARRQGNAAPPIPQPMG